MSYTAVGRNKVYASIEDLPENQKLVDGDRILIQTEDGTALVDYANVKIDLNHTTFSTQITSLIEFSSAVESFVDTMEAEFTAIKEESITMKNKLEEIQQQMECVKLLFKFVMGYVNKAEDKTINMELDNTLTGAGRAMYDECINALKTVEP